MQQIQGSSVDPESRNNLRCSMSEASELWMQHERRIRWKTISKWKEWGQARAKDSLQQENDEAETRAVFEQANLDDC